MRSRRVSTKLAIRFAWHLKKEPKSRLESTASAVSAGSCCARHSAAYAARERSSRPNQHRCGAHQRGQGAAFSLPLICLNSTAFTVVGTKPSQWRPTTLSPLERPRRLSASTPRPGTWHGRARLRIVLECTGKFLKPDQLKAYFDRGVKRVIVAAPVKDEAALNIVVGVNDKLYDPAKHRLLTAASCTTNCLAPVVKVIHESIGIGTARSQQSMIPQTQSRSRCAS